MTANLDMVGRRFGRLVVTELAGKSQFGEFQWACLCDCGVPIIRTGSVLRTREKQSARQSCGCWKSELSAERARAPTSNVRISSLKHGMASTGIYKIWVSMIQRCETPGSSGFEQYGGRGIAVCERWHTFENFYADMGDRPAGRSIDRKDNDQGYEPNNCRWATRVEQARNTSLNAIVSLHGSHMTMAELAERTGINCNTLTYRIRKMGLSVEDAVGLPIRRRSA